MLAEQAAVARIGEGDLHVYFHFAGFLPLIRVVDVLIGVRYSAHKNPYNSSFLKHAPHILHCISFVQSKVGLH